MYNTRLKVVKANGGGVYDLNIGDTIPIINGQMIIRFLDGDSYLFDVTGYDLTRLNKDWENFAEFEEIKEEIINEIKINDYTGNKLIFDCDEVSHKKFVNSLNKHSPIDVSIKDDYSTSMVSISIESAVEIRDYLNYLIGIADKSGYFEDKATKIKSEIEKMERQLADKRKELEKLGGK